MRDVQRVTNLVLLRKGVSFFNISLSWVKFDSKTIPVIIADQGNTDKENHFQLLDQKFGCLF